MRFRPTSASQCSNISHQLTDIQLRSFDIKMPIICDDHWNTPAPPNKLSVMAFFNSMLQLNHILSFSCTTLVRAGELPH